MFSLNAVKEHDPIKIGEECEIHAMMLDQSLCIKTYSEGRIIANVPCDVFGLEPNDIRLLIKHEEMHLLYGNR